MILDRLENVAMYRAASPELVRAFDYLERTDFSAMPEGRYEIDGDRVYAMVQRYRPKPLAEAKWEAHRRYLDVQYLAKGTERMGHILLDDGLAIEREYDAQNDYILYKAKGDFFTLRAGGFAIFAPQDVHAPGVAIDDAGASADVCKVVVKCRLAE